MPLTSPNPETTHRPAAPAAGAAGAAAVISLEGLTKHYRGGGGITDVTLQVEPGEIFGFLGPNGAGKTTTIRLLLDLIRPDRGRIRLFGLDPRRDGIAVRRRVGYLPGDLVLYDRLSARQVLSHLAFLRGRLPWAQVEALTDRFGVELDQPIRSLSKGNRQKVGVVQALMGHPDLLVLDEPTSGLDPLVQRQVHDALREAVADGATVLLSSHVLSEVEQVATRIGLIREGRLAAVERVADLSARSVHLVDVRLRDGAAPDALARVAGVVGRETVGNGTRLRVSGSLDPLVRALATCELEDLSVREPDLEELFLSFYATPEERHDAHQDA